MIPCVRGETGHVSVYQTTTTTDEYRFIQMHTDSYRFIQMTDLYENHAEFCKPLQISYRFTSRAKSLGSRLGLAGLAHYTIYRVVHNAPAQLATFSGRFVVTPGGPL